jgi:hypothetical protein
MSFNATKERYNYILSVLYGCETWEGHRQRVLMGIFRRKRKDNLRVKNITQ